MGKRTRQISGILLLVVYTFFFVSTNMFYHSHELADSKIVHSHPFGEKTHNHTAGQILLIADMTSEAYDASASVLSPLFSSDFIAVIVTGFLKAACAPELWTFKPLRAPPCL